MDSVDLEHGGDPLSPRPRDVLEAVKRALVAADLTVAGDASEEAEAMRVVTEFNRLGVGVVYPWKPSPRDEIQRRLDAIDYVEKVLGLPQNDLAQKAVRGTLRELLASLEGGA